METNIIVTPENAIETRICKCCGKEKPLSEFDKQARGYRRVCKECVSRNKNAERSEKFKAFESRELIEELRIRGYKGQLRKEVIKTITL